MLFIKRLFLLSLFIPSLLFARGFDDDYDLSGSFKLAANLDFYQLEPVFGLRINKSFHVNCGLRFQIANGYSYTDEINNYTWEIYDESEEEDDDDQLIRKFFFTPSIEYKLCLIEQKNDFSTNYFNLFIEPGILFQPFAIDNFKLFRNGKSQQMHNFRGPDFFFNCQSGLEYIIDNDIAFSLGYEISNQDIYISRRNVVIEDVSLNDFLPKRKLSHSIFIGIKIYV